MDHVLGSERSQPRPSTDNRSGQVALQRADQAPAGLCHALPIGSDVAVCGETGLIVWDQPWARGLRDRCRSCLDEVPLTVF